jgi:hypothetical protein
MLFQGCAKMTSRIGGYIGGGNWKSANGTAHYGRNFSLQWLKVHVFLIHFALIQFCRLVLFQTLELPSAIYSFELAPCHMEIFDVF